MSTSHTHGPNFGQREPGCPRCQELAEGAPARSGYWTPKYAGLESAAWGADGVKDLTAEETRRAYRKGAWS